MKAQYNKESLSTKECELEFGSSKLSEDIEKTRIALDVAYAGFDYVLDDALIDSYIYEINALQKRYDHLIMLANMSPDPKLRKHSSIGAGIRHIFR